MVEDTEPFKVEQEYYCHIDPAALPAKAVSDIVEVCLGRCQKVSICSIVYIGHWEMGVGLSEHMDRFTLSQLAHSLRRPAGHARARRVRAVGHIRCC